MGLLDQERGGRIGKARLRGILSFPVSLSSSVLSFSFFVSILKANLGIGVAEFYVRVFCSRFQFYFGLKYNRCFLESPLGYLCVVIERGYAM